jgi:HNH endonuclease
MTCPHARTLSVYSTEYLRCLEYRLLAKVRKETDCWIFTGCGDGNGYGKIGVYPTQLRAHVVSYLLYVGDVDAHIDIAHSCNVKRCIKPEHLYLATRSENVQHAIRDGLQKCRLADEQVREIRARYRFGNGVSLAREFGVDQQIVSRIVLGSAFRWVSNPLTPEIRGG